MPTSDDAGPILNTSATPDPLVAGSSETGSPVTGGVDFVFVNPDRPDLLTLAAARALTDTDVVLADGQQLVNALTASGVQLCPRTQVLLLPADAVGTDRVEAIVALTSRGMQVTRVLPDGSLNDDVTRRELAGCGRAGLRVDVLPWVSRCVASALSAGLSLADPHLQVVRVDTDTTAVATPAGGSMLACCRAGDLGLLAALLDQAGWDAQAPGLVVVRGATIDQLTVPCRLAQLTSVSAAQSLEDGDEVLVGVGESLQVPPELDWFATRALFGLRVLLPRTHRDLDAVVRQINRHGGCATTLDTTHVEPPRNPAPMNRAIRGLVDGRYQWIVFTSPNSVRAVLCGLQQYGLDARALSGLKLAALSPAAAAALRNWGIEADLVPGQDFSSDGLLAEFPAHDALLDPINRVFLPAADIAPQTLIDGLGRLGWEIDEVLATRTVRAKPPPLELRQKIKAGHFDAVVFTSSTTVRNLVGIAGKPAARTIVAAIGPSTAATCRERGLRVDVVGDGHDPVALVEALAAHAGGRRPHRIPIGQVGSSIEPPSHPRRSPAHKEQQ